MHRERGLRVEERRRVVLAAVWLGALLTGNAALRPLRDTLGVAGGVDRLHWLLSATFLAMLVALPLYALAVAKLGRRRLIPVIHHACAAQLLVFFVLLAGAPALLGRVCAGAQLVTLELWTARVFYVWTAVFNLFVVSLFWSVMADSFARADARRLFGLIAIGGSIGAIVGPSVSVAVALGLDPRWLPLLAAALLELANLTARRLLAVTRAVPEPRPDRERAATPAAPDDHDAAVGEPALRVIPALLRSPLLRGVCAYVLLLSASATVLYLLQARIVAASFADEASRTAVFAAIELGANLLALLIQATLTARVIDRLGLGRALALLPLACGLGLLALGLSPTLAVLVGAQLLRRSLNYAIARPARELLYTAVDRSQRYTAKSLIDTLVYRGGDALTGWGFALLQSLGLAAAAVALICVPLCALWAGLALRLGARPSPLHLDAEAREDR